MPKEKKDEHGIVLDFLKRGRVSASRDEPTALLIGTEYFSLLEVVLRDGEEVEPGESIYIGEGEREKVKYIKDSIIVDDLTAAGKDELEEQLDELIEDNEERLVDFFNNAGPITPRMHQLEALPGVGKKHMWEVIDERKVEKFDSYDDLKERVPLLPDPRKMVKKRIEDELSGDTDYYLFTVPKKKEGR